MLLSDNEYDELGRLQTNRHASPQPGIRVNPHIGARFNNQAEPPDLTTTYRYNLRNWLAGINNYYFIENLTYTYGGNVQTMRWKQGDYRKYTFTYDNLSRLKAAAFSEGKPSENFSTAYEYDQHGNMTHLTRYGQTGSTTYGIIDSLTYTYNNSNQVRNITDAGPNVALGASQDFKDYTKGTGIEYTYNANGAMIKDLNKGISAITYNILNLPRQMDIKSPVAEARNEYVYSAGGQKLKVIQKWNPSYSTAPAVGTDINTGALTLTKTTDYTGNKIYENDTLKMILTDNGYFDYSANKYYFYVRDHLGNNRVVADQNSNRVQSIQYYPFGMAMSISTGQDKQRFKYNNKELDLMHGLNMYDYSARHIDMTNPLFTTMDPLAEKYYSASPYAYCLNNPVRFVDRDGRAPGDIFKTPRDAAHDWGNYYNGVSILRGREYGSSIYVVKKDGEMVGYSYSIANVGNSSHVDVSTAPHLEPTVADIHSHGKYLEKKDNNNFSGNDKAENNRLKIPGYLATPDGSLQEYDPSTKKTSVISTDLPSDPNDPDRKNEIEPTNVPAEQRRATEQQKQEERDRMLTLPDRSAGKRN
jgi:RHS repeat-associated protein